MHFVVTYDNGTMKYYINGEEDEVSYTTTGTGWIGNVPTAFNTAGEGIWVGPGIQSGQNRPDIYLSDVYWLDGIVAGPEMFALKDPKGVYNPIPYNGDYGTNGFHLEFKADGDWYR